MPSRDDRGGGLTGRGWDICWSRLRRIGVANGAERQQRGRRNDSDSPEAHANTLKRSTLVVNMTGVTDLWLASPFGLDSKCPCRFDRSRKYIRQRNFAWSSFDGRFPLRA